MARLAMVTGASSGIGEAFADRLAADGWDLVLVARRRDRLEEVAERVKAAHGVSAVVLDVDLANAVQLEALCAEAADLPLGMLVNNAALAHYKPFAELPAEQAQELVQLNVLAPVMLTRAVLPGMVARGEGAVINVASLLAFSGAWDKPYLPKRAVYAASKSFLVTFSADPRRRAARQRRARAGRVPGRRALRVPHAPGHGHERGAEDGGRARSCRAASPISSAVSWSRSPELRKTRRCVTSPPRRRRWFRSRARSSCPSATRPDTSLRSPWLNSPDG